MLLRVALVWLALAVPAAAARTCASLASLQLPDTAITLAADVPAGGFTEAPGPRAPFAALPAFCRVTATLRPTADSDIRIEIWLPEAKGWNGKLEGAGNGGWAGSINYDDMAASLARGYAASSTDTGHTGGRASFAVGHPEKLIDFGYRSIHLMTMTAKAVIAAFYGSAPKLSYFAGCSSGGRQALMEAQRFPDDYDGIIAGAPTNNWTRLMFGRIWVAQSTLSDPASYIPPSQYPMIHQAVLAACDKLDGVKDGVLEDPRRCRFDPSVLACKGAANASCLTKAQVEAVDRIYSPAKNPRTGEEVFPQMERGSELVWSTLAGGPEPIRLADDYFRYVVFNQPQWDFRTLNFDGDVTKALDRDGGVLTANNPDLRPFFAHGGRLIQYHGWTDQQVMPRNSIHYYESVAARVGQAEAAEDYRLFMVPGMNHCGGGDGTSHFDMLTALEQWREQGRAPESVPASHTTDGRVDRTRPLCPYPQVARYRGTGSTDEAANFSCALP
ncbi:tannase/feruloyl esterase family alpha/beta hydrolase [Paracidobacterium acidisoli]|uniref:Tannase/feruloyl esterase family alpha/beta hydrolase n=1 Tax=Paracidobacterium acidisoli TaxID=2303751 RepID=A0A372IKY2_9BACT|nr:tannase/feruloyl esterase family alpha/beta hydrolase [Paracidobacterium acidisoli]MBT9332822.1 tannase/feruloyl esterase family alpha/beta hydrolase [Paracidobacterium acidisoli]